MNKKAHLYQKNKLSVIKTNLYFHDTLGTSYDFQEKDIL